MARLSETRWVFSAASTRARIRPSSDMSEENWRIGEPAFRELFSEFLATKRWAKTELLRQYAPVVCAAVRRELEAGASEPVTGFDSEDAEQETWQRFLSARKHSWYELGQPGESEFAEHLRELAAVSTRNMLAREENEKAAADALRERSDRAELVPPAEKWIDEAESMDRQLREAMLSLPRRKNRSRDLLIFMLIVLDGQPYDAVARQLGGSVSRDLIKKAYHRVRRAVEERLRGSQHA